MSTSLTEIANRYGTDKGTVGPTPDKPANGYTKVYETYLERHRQSSIRLLEIGLGVLGERWEAKIVRGRNTGGASMKMWYDYFPNARLYGIDVNECSYLDNDRISTFVADQGQVEELAAFVGSLDEPAFDVIVDDGSHRPDHQQTALSYLFKFLRPGGLYFIEDLMANGLGNGVTGRMACDSVLNTRRVLKQYVASGHFPEPHALLEPDTLKREIAAVSFHLPRPVAGVNTEKLCVIEKK